ncbi:LamG domain-containing protein [Luedemannella flava]|uniref:LamG domain-containing protein n=1 Tax=Luedemannella flava TaxID=349316 RepID=A0ABP4XSR5_9ACTN
MSARPTRRVALWLGAAAVLAAGALVPVVLARAADAAAVPACPAAVAKPDEASKRARECRGKVEITDLTTETALTVANPDGSFTLRQDLSPQRVRRDNGWVPVDTTLRFAADGSVRPAATGTDIRFSGGGDAALASLGKDGKELALGWPTALPKPTLDGDTATYAEVLPGVDLTVTADAHGFSEVLVVKTRAAAKNPALAALTFRTATKGVSLHRRADGNVDARDSAGRTVFGSSDALMWDSPRPGSGAPDRPHRTVKMPQKLGKGTLTVVPDAGVLTDPQTVFPVYIDPSFSANRTGYTVVNKAAPDTSYYSSGYRNALRVGREYGSSNTWRSFFQFDISSLFGMTVKSAGVFLTLDHSASCTATPVQLYSSTKVSDWAPLTWNNTKSRMVSLIQTKSMHANESSCPQPDHLAEFASSGVAKLVQKQVDAKINRAAFALRASDETDQTQWKKFYEGADRTFLQVSYNRPPNKPSPLSISPCDSACASPAVVSNRAPKLMAKVSDPDGGTLSVKYEVSFTSSGSVVRTATVTGVASGATAAWTVSPTFSGDAGYRFRVQACDAYDCGAWSNYFNFTTDMVNPPPPKVAPVNPALYFEDDDSGEASGGMGVAGQLQITPNGGKDIVEYEWWLDDTKKHTITTSLDTNKAAKITVKPVKDGPRTLTVLGRDAAGRSSSASTYTFRVASAEVSAGIWSLDEAAGATVAVNALRQPEGETVPDLRFLNGSVLGGVAFGTARGTEDRGATFDGSTGYIATSGPVLATDGSPDPYDTTAEPDPRGFSVAAWVYAADTADRVAVSQNGSLHSIFRLGLSGGKWCFTVDTADTSAGTSVKACSTLAVKTNAWVHLTGVYDAATKQIRIMAFDADCTAPNAAATAFTTAPWHAMGAFVIGRGLNGSGVAANYWKGAIDEVHAYERAVPEVEGVNLCLN